MKSLDYLAQVCAQDILAETKEDEVAVLATKALGALEEAGVYTCLLFLLSRKKDEGDLAKKIVRPLRKLATEAAGTKWPEDEDITEDSLLKAVTSKICVDPEKMLLVRDVWQQALIYTRYGAKARKQ